MTSVSCASSVSGHKSTPNSQADNRSKSCDTNCTSNSSCFFKRRKPMNPLAYSMHPAYHKTNNPVKQRVMSAKLLKVRQLQSQLNDANFHLAEVARENQTLKTLQKRQDKALSKYENTNADLPRLIHSHEEEIRMLTDKNRNLKKTVRDLAEQLKQKQEELVKAKEQLTHLEKLNKDKHLTEREKLTDKMEDYKIKLQKNEEQVTILNRKLMLETKTSKQRLNAEMLRHKQCQKELLHAFNEIDRLTGLLDIKENTVRPKNTRFNKRFHPATNNLSNDKLMTKSPVTDVKLEPIANVKEIENICRKNENGFKAPIDNIKQRLYSGLMKTPPNTQVTCAQNSDTNIDSRDSSAGKSSRPTSSLKLEKLPSVQENQRIRTKMKLANEDKDEPKQNGEDDNHTDEEYIQDKDMIVRYDYENESKAALSNGILGNNIDDDNASRQNKSRLPDLSKDDSGNTSEEDVKDKRKLQDNKRRISDESSGSSQSEKDIEKMAENLDEVIQKATRHSKQEFDQNLSNYCSNVLSSMKNCNKVIESHKDSLRNSKEDTETLQDTFKRTEKMETKLKKSFFSLDDDMDIVKEILNEEHKFQLQNSTQNGHKNSNIEKKSLVNIENKKKLLATLRAIDNGDSIESLEEPKQDNIIKEIFGKVAH